MVMSQILCLLANIFAAQIVSCQNSCHSGPCYPPPKRISGDFNVTANSTCGDPPEQYCVMLNCSKVCNAKDPNSKHKAGFVNDPFADNLKLRVPCYVTVRLWKKFYALSVCGDILPRTACSDVPFEVK